MIDNKALSSSTYYWYSTVITLYRIESATHLYTRIDVPSDSAAGLIKYTDVKVHDVQFEAWSYRHNRTIACTYMERVILTVLLVAGRHSQPLACHGSTSMRPIKGVRCTLILDTIKLRKAYRGFIGMRIKGAIEG
jgi:hypothetical protein